MRRSPPRGLAATPQRPAGLRVRDRLRHVHAEAAADARRGGRGARVLLPDAPADVLSLRGYFAGGSRRRRGRDVDNPWRRVAATPRLRRGHSTETGRDAAAATWMEVPRTRTFRGDGSAATPRLWMFGRDRRTPQVYRRRSTGETTPLGREREAAGGRQDLADLFEGDRHAHRRPDQERRHDVRRSEERPAVRDVPAPGAVSPPRRSRGVAAIHQRTIHVAAAASPRPASDASRTRGSVHAHVVVDPFQALGLRRELRAEPAEEVGRNLAAHAVAVDHGALAAPLDLGLDARLKGGEVTVARLHELRREAEVVGHRVERRGVVAVVDLRPDSANEIRSPTRRPAPRGGAATQCARRARSNSFSNIRRNPSPRRELTIHVAAAASPRPATQRGSMPRGRRTSASMTPLMECANMPRRPSARL